MGLFDLFRRGSVVARAARGENFGVTIPPEMTQSTITTYVVSTGAIAAPVGRVEALQVPAVLRCRNLIAGTLGTLPVVIHGPDRAVVSCGLLAQPEVDVPRSVTMTHTIEDMLFDGVAWWRVIKRAWTGYPDKVRRIDPSWVSVHPDGNVYINGEHVPDSELIRFVSPNPALLHAGARAIRTCAKLDMAAANYAEEPEPMGYFYPKDGIDPAEDADIALMLDAYKAARATRGRAYIPAALGYEQLQWSPEQLQLADARQHAVLEIARAAGVDPEDVGVSTTSRTYANNEQRRQDFKDFTLGAYVSAIEGRLTMGDVTPNGYYAKFKWEGFLRSDTTTRYNSYKIGLEVGAVDASEIRELEDKPDTKVKSAPTAPVGTKQVGVANG